MSCAFAMERAGSTEGMDRMRAAIVRNRAARLASEELEKLRPDEVDAE